jgi:cysteinyl-tRNA synthetase
MPIDLKVYDSYQKQIVTITENDTVNYGTIKLYSCGPTVYNYQHIGNMRAVFLADTLVSVCQLIGYQTHWVLNITDVGHLVGDGDNGKNSTDTEDKMEMTARKLNKDVVDIVSFYTNDYLDQVNSLNLNLPNNIEEFQKDLNTSVVNPLATEFIEEQMILALELLRDGKAYILDDGIYYDSIANKDLEVPFRIVEGDSEFTGRDIKNATKNPADFALWKFVEEETLQKWKFADYPQALDVLSYCDLDGRIMHKWGCPGWHSECVAMIASILGRKLVKNRNEFTFTDFKDKTVIDIHLGGEDHIDIHHKNEILQSESLGFHLSNYWVHNKFLIVDGKKMSKSDGNVYLVTGKKEVTGFDSIEEKGYDPLAFRMMVLEHGYSVTLDFTFAKLTQSQTRLFNLRKEIAKLISFSQDCEDKFVDGSYFEHQKIDSQWQALLADNLNTPRFLEVYTSYVLELVNFITANDMLMKQDLELAQKYDHQILKLALFVDDIDEDIIRQGIERIEAKNAKDYALSDEIRQSVAEQGFQIDDYKWGWGIWWNPTLSK